jgi:hypothetical protein
VVNAACQIAENLEWVVEFVAPAGRRRYRVRIFRNTGNDFSSVNLSRREDRGLVRGNSLIAERLHEAKKESHIGQTKRESISEHSRAFAAPADALPA